jgi:hypothetical protein
VFAQWRPVSGPLAERSSCKIATLLPSPAKKKLRSGYYFSLVVFLSHILSFIFFFACFLPCCSQRNRKLYNTHTHTHIHSNHQQNSCKLCENEFLYKEFYDRGGRFSRGIYPCPRRIRNWRQLLFPPNPSCVVNVRISTGASDKEDKKVRQGTLYIMDETPGGWFHFFFTVAPAMMFTLISYSLQARPKDECNDVRDRCLHPNQCNLFMLFQRTNNLLIRAKRQVVDTRSKDSG